MYKPLFPAAMVMTMVSISMTVIIPISLMPLRMPISVFSSGNSHNAARDPAVSNHDPFLMRAPASKPMSLTNNPI
jgi:hypothetical protein